MFRLFLFMVLAVFYTGSANAKYISEYLSDVEVLLLEKKYDQADVEFKKVKKSVQNQSVSGSIVRLIYKDTVDWLKKIDEITNFIERVDGNEELYKANGNYGVSLKNCQERDCERYDTGMINSGLPSSLPFSSNLVAYVNSYRKQTIESFKALNMRLNEAAEAEKQRQREERKAERERKKLEAKLKREKEEQERQRKKNEKRIAIDNEVAKINKLAKSSGYSGYSNMSLIAMIYKTQKEGGLEKHLNNIVGCHDLDKKPCERWYPKLKAIQVLDDGILYSFSEYSGREYVNFTIFADREKGKIYQEGQSFENSYYVFNGMLSYTTVAGAKKTVPSFSKAELH